MVIGGPNRLARLKTPSYLGLEAGRMGVLGLVRDLGGQREPLAASRGWGGLPAPLGQVTPSGEARGAGGREGAFLLAQLTRR